MIIGDCARVKWNARNKKYFESLGYVYTGINTELIVKICDLKPYSNAIISVKCDYCNKDVWETTWNQYQLTHKRTIINKDACNNCLQIKIKESNLEKYGVEHYTQLESVKKEFSKNQKIIQNTDEVKTKIVNSNLKKYGVTCALKLDEYQQKYKDTCIKKYGVDNYAKTEEFRNKFSKEGSPVWKGGVEHSRQERATLEYGDWRKSCFERDHFTCQCCKEHNDKLEAHHILNWKDNENERYNTENGITLCKKCHSLFHGIYGKRNNTLLQLNDFIKEYGKKIC